MKRIITIVIVIAILVAVGLRLKRNHAAINKPQSSSGITSEVSVNVSEVKEMTSGHTLNLTGVLSPATELNISAQSQGQITSLNAELGQHKQKGNVIATIDNKMKLLAVQTAKVSEAKLKRDLGRYENLFKGGSVTEQQLDDARNAHNNAKIQLDQSQKQLDDATVISPISGVITLKQAERGSYINIGSPIVSIADISTLKIKINVSETNVYQLKQGNKAKVTTEVYPGNSFDGHISFISSTGDETHNYPVEIEMPNSVRNPLKAGTFVNVSITVPGKAKALYILREALQGSSQDAHVYVAENGKAVLKKIVVINGNDQYLQVLSGLNHGEKVVITGQINLSEGKGLHIVESK